MNAFELLRRQEVNGIVSYVLTGVFACGKCGLLCGTKYDGNPRERAEECCTPGRCRECGAEKDPADQHYTNCAPCRRKNDAQKELDRITTAEKLDSWDGPVYCEGAVSGQNYFESVEELIGELETSEVPASEWPEYADTCRSEPACVLDLDAILEYATQESFEDATDHLNGTEELGAAIEKFNALNVGVVTYYPNSKQIVRIRPVTS